VVERLRAAAPEGVGKNAEVLVGSDRILASVCEAIIGAAYLTFGFERVAPAIVDAFADQVEDALANPVDFKSLLQEHLARRSQLVSYRIDEETGPPHDRSFIAAAEVEGEEIGRGAG
jgi:ribonuclease-3